jgi:hypothetical protein
MSIQIYLCIVEENDHELVTSSFQTVQNIREIMLCKSLTTICPMNVMPRLQIVLCEKVCAEFEPNDKRVKCCIEKVDESHVKVTMSLLPEWRPEILHEICNSVVMKELREEKRKDLSKKIFETFRKEHSDWNCAWVKIFGEGYKEQITVLRSDSLRASQMKKVMGSRTTKYFIKQHCDANAPYIMMCLPLRDPWAGIQIHDFQPKSQDPRTWVPYVDDFINTMCQHTEDIISGHSALDPKSLVSWEQMLKLDGDAALRTLEFMVRFGKI